MTYPYGTKTAPTVGRGLGGLPRRAPSGGGVSVEEFVQSTVTNQCEVNDLIYTNEVSGASVALDLASAPTGTLGAVNPISSAYLKESFSPYAEYVSQSPVTEEYAKVGLSSSTVTIEIYNTENTQTQTISHTISSFSNGGVDSPEVDYIHVLFFPSSEKFLFFTQGRDSSSNKYGYFKIYEKVSGTYTDQGDWRSSSFGDDSPRIITAAIDEVNEYVYFAVKDSPSVAGGTSRTRVNRTTFNTDGHTTVVQGGGGEYDLATSAAIDVNNNYIYIDKRTWNGSQWRLHLRAFTLSGSYIRELLIASAGAGSYPLGTTISVSKATGLIRFVYRTSSTSSRVRTTSSGASSSGSDAFLPSNANLKFPPIFIQDGSWYAIYITNYSSVGALFLVSPSGSSTIIEAESGVTSGVTVIFVGNNNDIHISDNSTNTRYVYALFEEGSYHFTGIATESGNANASIQTRINGLTDFSGNAFVDSSAGDGAIMVASGGKALLSSIDL